MARMVRRVWFGVLGEPSDLSSMDDSTDRGGPQAPRTVQAGILHSMWAEFPWAKSEAKVEQGVGRGVAVWWVNWEEAGTWGRCSPGLPGLISLRLSLYGHGP